MRLPTLIKPGSVRDPMVLGIDMAPTLLELAGVRAPAGLHGRSLVPLLKRDGPGVRKAFLVEHFSDNVFPRTRKMGYQAVRSEQWKYIHYVDLSGMDELYDLREDPHEMKNLISDPRAAQTLRQMQDELTRQLRATGADRK
jgi:N-acetylglucosamine-6-sulfatase